MTGRSPGQTRITYWTLHKDRDTSRPHDQLAAPAWRMNGLNSDDVTLPKLLRDTGFRTIHVGKAHLAAHGSEGDDLALLGFDVNIAGHASGAPASYYGEQDFSAAGKMGNAESKPGVWDVPGLEKYHGQDIYLTEALQVEACREMRDAVEANQPFFLHFAPYAVHTPIMANERYLENYPNLDPTEAAYATMVQSVDAALGAILDTLEELAVRENTVIVFTSDNGGLSAVGRGGQPHTHNAPLRSGKGSAYEGGTRVPLVISWPGFRHHQKSTQAFVSHDLFPTLLSAGGVEIPSSLAEGLEGRDFSSSLSVFGVFADGKPLFWNQPHQWGAAGPGIEPFTSIVDGPHKLIYFHAGPRFELYDLKEDPGEAHNLAALNPDRVKQLAKKIDTWIQTYDVQLSIDKETGSPIPLPGAAFVQITEPK